MGLFFVTVGMQLDISFVFDNTGIIIAALVGILILKIAVVTVSSLFMGERKQDALACAIMLWQMG